MRRLESIATAFMDSYRAVNGLEPLDDVEDDVEMTETEDADEDEDAGGEGE